MLRTYMLAGGWLALANVTAPAQFAVDRKTPAPATPPVAAPTTLPGAGVTELLPYNPSTPGQTKPAAGIRPSFPPAQSPTSSPAPPRTSHALTVAPHHGEWLICVKSYSGPEALALAEGLAADVRKQHANVPVYLFEYYAEERARLAAEQQQARQAVYERTVPFLKVEEEQKAKAAKEGRTFVEDGPVKVRVPKLLTQVPDQWAVLVGGYKTPEAARKALDTVHKWAPPSDSRLMDKMTAMVTTKEQKGFAEQAKMVVDKVEDVNPYPTAMCVKNPSLSKSTAEQPAADPSLWKWNDGEPLSVLNCPKPYTLIVKAFTMPVVATGRDQEPSVMQTAGQSRAGQANNAQQLAITAIQARNLATMLRGMKDKAGQPKGFESYVLHMKTGSVVCVGQFDREDDPGMADVVQRLTAFSLNLSSDADGRQPVRPGERSFFDQVSVLKIPRR